MITNIIPIGNSRGVRIPKPLLEESGLSGAVELKVKKGEIRLVPAKTDTKSKNETMLLSEDSLSDWLNREEDEAWESLQ